MAACSAVIEGSSTAPEWRNCLKTLRLEHQAVRPSRAESRGERLTRYHCADYVSRKLRPRPRTMTISFRWLYAGSIDMMEVYQGGGGRQP